MDKILTNVSAIKEDVEKQTDCFLDDMDNYKMNKFTMIFNGKAVTIPIDYAEINNSIQDFLTELVDVLTDF